MKKYLKYVLVILLTFLLVTNVSAKEKSYNGLKIKADEEITIEENINGSAIYAAKDLTNKGKINGIALYAAQTINLDGEIEYGFLAAETINVNGTIKKDSALAANKIIVSKEAVFNRDTIIAAEDITINGTLNRDAVLTGDIVRLSGATIEGDVKIYADKIIIDSDSVIKGKLSYTPENVKIAEDAKIGSTEIIQVTKVSKKEYIIDKIKLTLTSIIGLLVVFVLLHLTAPKLFEKIIEQTKDGKNIGKSLVIGLAVLAATPMIGLFLLFTSFGIAAGLLLIDLYIVAMYLSIIFSGYVVGYIGWTKLIKNEENPYLFGSLGIIAIKLLSLIPGLGELLMFASLLLGLGITFNLIKNIER